MPTVLRTLGSKPLPNGPLSDLAIPENLDEVTMQLDMLAEYYDQEYRHIEADRLLLVALDLCKDFDSVAVVNSVITAFNKVQKVYV